MRHSLRFALLLLAAVVCRAEDMPVAPRETGLSAEENGTPRIAASGGDFVVTWNADLPRFARIRHDEVHVTGTLGQPGSVIATVAGPGGSVLVALGDVDGIHIARIAQDGDVQISDVVAPSFSSMAWNGTRLLLVTGDGDTIFTDENGHIIARGPILTLGQFGSSASARGNGFAVAWGDMGIMHVATLTSDGTVAREQTMPSQSIQYASIACANASLCLLLNPPFFRVLGTESIGSEMQLPDAPSAPSALVWDGLRFLVAWTADGATTHLEGINPSGTVTRVADLQWPSSLDRQNPVLAHAGGESVVAWTEKLRCGSAGTQIVARSLVTGRELRLTHGLATQGEPTITAGTNTSLVAWVERGGTARIRARVFPFTQPAFDVSDGPTSSSPVIGTDGSNYLVAWHEALGDDFCRKALRISIAGSGTIHTLAHGVDSGLQIAWNGSEYVVLWEESWPTGMFAVRVDRAGQPIDSVPVPVSLAESDNSFFWAIDHEPAGLFWTGDGYLLVWRRSRYLTVPAYPYPPRELEVRTTRLGPDLLPVEAPQTIASAFALVAARRGDTIAAIWYTGDTLQAARLSPDGTVLETHPLEVERREPSSLIPTRTGYALLTYDEILSLGDDLSLTGRRPLRPGLSSLIGTPAGIYEVYADSGSVYLSPPEIRRRRPVR